MALQELVQPLGRGRVELDSLDEFVVQPRVSPLHGIVDEQLAAAHPRGEVAARLAEQDDGARGHVLAAVRADTLDDGNGARVAHGETLAGRPAQKSSPPVAP